MNRSPRTRAWLAAYLALAACAGPDGMVPDGAIPASLRRLYAQRLRYVPLTDAEIDAVCQWIEAGAPP